MTEERTLTREMLREKLAEDCSICLCPKTEPVVILDCDHTFDRECLRQAFLSKRRPRELKCPICRHLSTNFGEIPNFDRLFIHDEPLWVLGLPAYPPDPEKRYLSPQIQLNDELYDYLDRVVAEWRARRSEEQADSGRQDRNELALALHDSGNEQLTSDREDEVRVVDDSRPLQSPLRAVPNNEDARRRDDHGRDSPVPGPSDSSTPLRPLVIQAQVSTISQSHFGETRASANDSRPSQASPLPSTSRADVSSSCQRVRSIRSHSGRGRNISYEVEFSDGTVSFVPKSVVAHTIAYREYYRQIRNEYQRLYLARRR